MRFFGVSVSVFAFACFLSPVSVSVSAACLGDKTESSVENPDPNAGIPLGGMTGGTPSADAVPLFWTLASQTGNMARSPQNGGLGGLLGADFFCNRVAKNALATDLLQERGALNLFKAILSNRHTDAITRFDNVAAAGTTVQHDVVDSTGKCIAANVDDLFFAGFNLDYSLPDDRGTIPGKDAVVDLWTGSLDDGTRWKVPTGSEDAQANLILNNAYCSLSSDANDLGWSAEIGEGIASATGTIADDSQNSAQKWLATGASQGCVQGLHLLCLQGAPTPTQSSVAQDPQFIGLQGQHYQVHGMPDEYFNLISSPDMQLNSRFTYLASGQCNYNNTECWTHPGTYVDQLGFMFPGLTIKAIAGSHQDGMTVYVNDKQLITNTRSTQHTIHSLTHQQQHHHDHDINSTQIITVTYKQQDQLIVAAPLFTITATNSDMFFNFGVSLHSPSLLSSGSSLHHVSDKSSSSVYPSFPLHGLLGQTWKNARYPHGRMFAGTVDDYMLLDSKIVSTKFVYNQYKH